MVHTSTSYGRLSVAKGVAMDFRSSILHTHRDNIFVIITEQLYSFAPLSKTSYEFYFSG